MIRNGLLETDQIYFVLALPYFLLCGVRISVQILRLLSTVRSQ
jgi:hypothetical protein